MEWVVSCTSWSHLIVATTKEEAEAIFRNWHPTSEEVVVKLPNTITMYDMELAPAYENAEYI